MRRASSVGRAASWNAAAAVAASAAASAADDDDDENDGACGGSAGAVAAHIDRPSPSFSCGMGLFACLVM